jgi:hypothetical protein
MSFTIGVPSAAGAFADQLNGIDAQGSAPLATKDEIAIGAKLVPFKEPHRIRLQRVAAVLGALAAAHQERAFTRLQIEIGATQIDRLGHAQAVAIDERKQELVTLALAAVPAGRDDDTPRLLGVRYLPDIRLFIARSGSAHSCNSREMLVVVQPVARNTRHRTQKAECFQGALAHERCWVNSLTEAAGVVRSRQVTYLVLSCS